MFQATSFTLKYTEYLEIVTLLMFMRYKIPNVKHVKIYVHVYSVNIYTVTVYVCTCMESN